jgi:hypothetical protein
MAWGHSSGHPPGVWLLTPGTSKFLGPMDRIIDAIKGRGSPVIIGTRAKQPRTLFYLMPQGIWEVGSDAVVQICSGALNVLENFAGRAYTYGVSHRGITDFSAVMLPDGSVPVKMYERDGIPFLLSRRATQSRIQEIVTCGFSRVPVTYPIDGDVLDVYPSPNGKSVLWRMHPRGAPEGYCLLLLDGVRPLFEGKFDMQHQDVTWSRNETSAVVRIRVRKKGRERSMLVTPTMKIRIPTGTIATEAVVNDSGGILAYIASRGGSDQVILDGRVGPRMPLALNLHEDSTGATVWTSMHDKRILKWVDRSF